MSAAGKAAAAFAAALCALGVAPAAAGEPATTSVSSFSWSDEEAGTDFFDGAISSAETKCLKGRRVTLNRKEGGGHQRLKRVRTDGDGEFLIEREDPGSGEYYVVVKRKQLEGVTCRTARTGSLIVSDLPDV